MSIIGIPHCPHCKKGMNVFRIWKLKKQGEYLCPSCKNVSNIYLSPLVYILAFIAISISFAIYYFSKILFKEVGLITVVYVIIPFAIFYILSLFMVYLKKPVVRKITKTKDGKYYDQSGKEMKISMGRFVYLNPADNKKSETTKTQDVSKIDPQADLVDIYSLNKSKNSKVGSTAKKQEKSESELIKIEQEKRDQEKIEQARRLQVKRDLIRREQIIEEQEKRNQSINQQNFVNDREINTNNELIFEQKTKKNENTSDKKYFDLFDDN